MPMGDSKIIFPTLIHELVLDDIIRGVIYVDDNHIIRIGQTENRKKKRTLSGPGFKNAVIICIKSIETPSKIVHFRIFKSGTIHLVGCKSDMAISHTIRVGLELLTKLYIKNKTLIIPSFYIPNISKFHLEAYPYNILMINATFKINFRIDLIELVSILTKLSPPHMFISYDPIGKHPGVKISFRKKGDISNMGTAFIHSTGPVVMTGVTSLEALETIYKDICKIVDTYSVQIRRVELLEEAEPILA